MSKKTTALCPCCGDRDTAAGIREPLCLNCLTREYLSGADFEYDMNDAGYDAATDLVQQLADRGDPGMTILDIGAETLSQDARTAYEHTAAIDVADSNARQNAAYWLTQVVGDCAAMLAWLNQVDKEQNEKEES